VLEHHYESYWSVLSCAKIVVVCKAGDFAGYHLLDVMGWEIGGRRRAKRYAISHRSLIQVSKASQGQAHVVQDSRPLARSVNGVEKVESKIVYPRLRRQLHFFPDVSAIAAANA
jgi:hypothetical protein